MLTLLWPNVVHSDGKIPHYIQEAAKEFDIDVALLYAICSVESKCRSTAVNHDDGTKSQKTQGVVSKSFGMFQIKVSTAKGLGFKSNHRDLMRPDINTWYAAKLLRHLYDRYGETPKVISAYNAGRYITSNKAYVNEVLTNYAKFKIDMGL